jgi:ornithine cyclodeaminase/alanine dehydrogenase-like protein (mu-crystallin family)
LITGLRPKELARSLGHTTLRLMRRDSVPDAVRGSDIVTTVSADKTNAPKITLFDSAGFALALAA